MKKFYALFATLFAATSILAADGDILEIRPCDAFGNSTAYPRATIAAPLGSGESLYFNIRLLSREGNSTADPVGNRSYFGVNYSGSAPELDAVLNPLKIGIVVSGKTKWASLVTCRKTRSSSGQDTLNLTDLVFEYHTEPGDFALPIKLASDDKGTPAGEDDSGASYIFRNDNLWQVQYHKKDGAGTSAALFLFTSSITGKDLSDYPDAEPLRSNYSMKDCGFHVQTVDFEKPWESAAAWRTVQEGVTVPGTLEVTAPVTNAVTLYVWSDDESAVKPVGSNVSVVKGMVVGYTAGGQEITKDVSVAAVTVQGGQITGDFAFKGIERGKTANLVLSGFNHYNFNVKGTGGTLITDFVTVPVTCTEPPPPYVDFDTEKALSVKVPVDQRQCVAQFKLSLSTPYTNGDGKVTLTVAPVPTVSGVDTYKFIRLSQNYNATTAWDDYQGPVTNLVFDTTSTDPKALEKTVYVYALGGNDNTSTDTKRFNMRVVKIEPADAATFFGTIKDSGYISLVPQMPGLVTPEQGFTDTVSQGESYRFKIQVEDNFYNIHDTNTGYRVYLNTRRLGKLSGWQDLCTNGFVVSNGALYEREPDGSASKRQPSFVFKQSGEIDVSLFIVAPNGLTSPVENMTTDLTSAADFNACRTGRITVREPSTAGFSVVNAEGEENPESFNEGDTATVRITLSEAPGEDVYAFLAPKDASTLVNVTGRCMTNNANSVGILVKADKTSGSTTGTITFEDGTAEGTIPEFDVILCSEKKFRADKVVPGWTTGETPTLVVYNVFPTIDEVTINDEGGRVDANGDIWLGTASIGAPTTFRFLVSDPSDIDLNATGAQAFQLKYTVKGGGTNETATLYGDPNKASLTFKFTTKDDGATLTLWTFDKDMDAADTRVQKKVKRTVHFSVADKPYVQVIDAASGEAKGTFFEDAVGSEDGRLLVSFFQAGTEYRASDPLDVRLVVSNIAESAENPGTLKLKGMGLSGGVNGIYALSIPAGTSSAEIYIDSDADGTDNSQFAIYAEVTTTKPNPEGARWCDYFTGSQTPVTLRNKHPKLDVSIDKTTPDADGWLCGSCSYQNTITNALVGSIGENKAIRWRVKDVKADLGSAGSGTNIVVTWSSGDGEYTTNVTESTWLTYSPKFTTGGTRTVTVTVEDKDGYVTSASWYYKVETSKQLTTRAHGPAGASSVGASTRYTGAGVGEGHTWTDKSFASASDFAITWNCGLSKTVNCYAWGYRVANPLDNGTLNGGKDVTIDKSGDNKSGDPKKVLNYYNYTNSVPQLDSFFYRWLLISSPSKGDSSSDGNAAAFKTLSPETTAGKTTTAVLALPTEEDKEGGYGEIVVEAVFSKEFLKSDNCGDINNDGIPDAYVLAYQFDVIDSEGNLVGNDMLTLDNLGKNPQTNADADYLPYIETATYATFAPGLSNTWVTAGRAFTTKTEIRGWGECLNDAPSKPYVKVSGIQPTVRYTNPEEDEDSTLTPTEWDAYVQAGQPGEDKWSPERPTDPTTADTDDDGMPDGYEYYIWYKATVGWLDGDGKHHYLSGRKYNPLNPFEPVEISPAELAAKFDPLSGAGVDWDTADTDNDGIPDTVEFMIGTSPFDYDSDGDGLPDGYELNFTKTNPLKYATDDVHCDATLNDYGAGTHQGDVMAEYTTSFNTVGVMAKDGTTEWFGCDPTTNFFTSVTEAEGKATLVSLVSTNNENKVSTNLYLTTKTVVVTNGVLVGDYGRGSTWTARYDDSEPPRLLCGNPVKLSRGTAVSEVTPDQTYYNEEVAFPPTYYVLWTYGKNADGSPVLARGRKTTETPTMKSVCAAVQSRSVKVQHYYVRRTRPFSPHTGWKDVSGPVDSRSFTHMDEFLVMTFFYRAGALTEENLTPTADRSMIQIWTDYTTNPTTADTDGDNMPDGWELYLMGGTEDSVGAGPGPDMIYSPLYPFDKVTGRDRDNDTDYIDWTEEYSGTQSSAYYAGQCASIFQLNVDWRNKSMPTDPWNADTDGDGVLDGEEGGKYPSPPPDSSYGKAVRDFFMYNKSGMAGGGLNPLTWDTDRDGLPDPWEIEFHGTYKQGGTEQAGTNSAETVTTGCTWNMDGMNGTVADARIDYDHDGLANWQEYMVGAMRCWRYDDPESVWVAQRAAPSELNAIMAAGLGSAEWNQYWADRLLDRANVNGKFNPNFANGFFDAGSAYFSCCTNAFDGVKGSFYMLRDGVYHDQASSMRWMNKLETIGIGMNPYALRYISCDPREHDTDGDGMDDYYELFHGLNPMLGEPAMLKGPNGMAHDVVADAYLRGFNDPLFASKTTGFSALVNWWRNDNAPHVTVPGTKAGGDIKNKELDGWDFVAHPWLNGSVSADPDGDNVGNQEEAIVANVQAAPTYHHTDPTPLWMTDSTYTNSLTRRYYRVNAPQGFDDMSAWSYILSENPTFTDPATSNVYYLTSFPGFTYNPLLQQLSFSYTLNLWSVYNGWEYSFEENEGYDSDHDFLSDFEEAQGKTKNASDPQGHDDPYRRQAMYFGGDANKSFLQTPVSVVEREPDSPDASCEARQNFLYYTVECWAKPDAGTVEENNRLQTLVERAIWANNAGPADEKLLRKNFHIGIRNGRWYTRFDSTGTDKNQYVEITDGPVATTNWTHVAATFDGTALRLYVNGVCNNVHATTIQPEHGINALAISAAGEMNPAGGTVAVESDCITILVGASAATQKGIVFDYAWRYRDGQYNDYDKNPEGLALDKSGNVDQTTLADYDSFYKGYVDEVRIWDGARSAADIKSDYDNRTRYTTELAKENRLAVYAQWKQGGLRSPASSVQLPPQLMYHWAFDHIAGAVLAKDVIQVPAGFNTAKTVTDAKARWVRPADYVERNWNSTAVRSTVYADNAFVPWINNTVAHMPRLDQTTLDSAYWSEDYAGHVAAGSYGYTSFAFPRTHEVYSRWTQQKYSGAEFYDMNLDRDFAYWNGNTAPAMSRGYTQRSRWDLIAGYGSTSLGTGAVSNQTEAALAFRFSLRDRNVSGDDLLPMGGAYPRRISAAEGGMWDNKQGTAASASDAWAQTGKDSDNNGLPDWWEEYARANYCKKLSPRESLKWDTTVVYRNGVQMPAWQAYLRDLAAGLVKIGNKISYKSEYADTRDNDKDGLPDWWEELYGLDTSVNNADDDPDNDGLSNYQEYILGEYYLSNFKSQFEAAGVDVGGVRLSPILASSTPGQVVTDYFLRYTNTVFEIKTGDTSHFYANEYFGEIATDHDFMEDWWENLYALSYTSAKKYDPSADKDGDGWSTWAECRASLWRAYFPGNLIDQWTGSTSEQYVPCYPQPIIGVRPTYYGDQDISGKSLIVRTTSGQSIRTDATFVVPAVVDSQTRYIGPFVADRILHGHMSPGLLNADSIVFERALTGADRTYYWNWHWYGEDMQRRMPISGTFDRYRYWYALYPHIELEGAELTWEGFAQTIRSGDSTKADIYIGTTKFGSVDCTTGEYELDMSKFSGEKEVSQYVFRVTYSSRLGEKWPQTVYLSDTKELETTGIVGIGDGYVREGKNTIEAFIDLGDGAGGQPNGKWDAGEPFGVVQNVDVGWHKTPVTVIELKDTAHAVVRYDVGTGKDDRSAIDGTAGSGSEKQGDSADKSATGISKTITIRRSAINGMTNIVSATGMLVAVPKRTMATRTLVLDSRSYLTEADVLSDAKFDLDYKWLVRDAKKFGLTRSEIMDATYELSEVVTLGDGTTSNIVLKTFRNTFNAQRTPPVAVSPSQVAPVYASSPTFAFTSDDETMTAYRLQVRQADGEKALVYDSGVALLPGRVPNAAGASVYEVTPAIYAGAHVWSGITTNHLLFADSANYEWRVALFNAKYSEIEAGEKGAWSAEDDAAWTTFQMDVQNANRYPNLPTGYGCLTLAVRYYGPTNVQDSAAKIYAEVFESGDFRGQPLARAEATLDATLASQSDIVTTNVIVRGIAPGKRFVRAFIDFNGNGKRDEWESWGYVNEVGNGVKAIYNPIAIDVTAAASDWKPIATAQYTLFVEDCDTNQNEFPDCVEASFYTGEGLVSAADGDGDGIADDDEESYSTNKALWDTDNDGMPDGWEAVFADTDPTLSDADETADGDVMAFAKVAAQFVTVGGKTYALADGEKLPQVGDTLKGLSVYTTYTYPVWENGALVEYKGVGTNLTLTTAERVSAVNANGVAVLVHAQVYEKFGFDATTATAADGAKNTKAFTALDKYLVVRYLTALGLADEATVNANGVKYAPETAASSDWAKYTLKPYVTDYDVDGIPDGWELYVMFGPDGSASVAKLADAKISPWNYNDARDFSPDGKNADGTKREDVGMRLIDEYDGGTSPTDPWNVDTDRDNVIDAYAYAYHLKGGDAGKDFDGDGLSNYAEYLISKVFKFAELDPENPKTDGSCVDYFRKEGDLYFGEMFTDHDQVNDQWEQLYADRVGQSSDLFANRYVYDPEADWDNDGWSNWAEAQAGTNPEVEATPGIDGNLMREYPVPAIAARVVYNGSAVLAGDLVFQAWNQKTDPDMSGSPDATWTTAATNVTKYVGVNPGAVRSFHLGTGSVAPGSVRIDFRDAAFEKAVLVNGVEVKSYPGEAGDAQWYYFVQDRNGVLYTSSTNVAPVKVGTVDYSSGLITIDFGCDRLQGVAYGIAINGDSSTDYESNSSGEYSNYDKLDLSRSYVKINWTPVKVATAGNATYYLSDTGITEYYVREGLNKFVVFCDQDGNGAYTPGEPFGFVRDVDVGWQGGAFTVELTETSPVFARIDLKASDAAAASDRQVWQGGASTVTDIGDGKHEELCTTMGVSYKDGDAILDLAQTRLTRIRVLRVLVDGKPTLGVDYNGYTVPVKGVVLDKYLDLGARSYLHEGDFLTDGAFDVGWAQTQTQVYGRQVYENKNVGIPTFVDATNITYAIVIGEGAISSSNLVYRCVVTRVYDTVGARYESSGKTVAATIRPVIDSAKPQDYVYGARPTFRWAMQDGYGRNYNSYTAFKLQIRDGSRVVYDSGYRTAPTHDAQGYYSWALEDAIGTVVPASGSFTWRVSMYNAKFRDETFWNEQSDFYAYQNGGKSLSTATWSESGTIVVNMNNQQPMNDHGYSSVAATVKYAGPEAVLEDVGSDGTKGKCLVQAFETADFAGAPLGQSYVTDAIADTSSIVSNAVIRGLPQKGTYYLRAFIDSNGNGVKDDFESWGAANEPVTLTADVVTLPTVGIWIEDADTDGDWIPDAYEYAKAGNLTTMTGTIIGGDKIVFSGTVGSTGTAGISTGLSGASLTMFQSQWYSTQLTELYATVSLNAIRKAVEEKINPNTFAITALTLAPDGSKVTLTMSAEVSDSIAGQLLGKDFNLSSMATATVTVKVYRKTSLAAADWTLVCTSRKTFGVNDPQVEVPVTGVDMTSGFYKVEVVQ